MKSEVAGAKNVKPEETTTTSQATRYMVPRRRVMARERIDLDIKVKMFAGDPVPENVPRVPLHSGLNPTDRGALWIANAGRPLLTPK
jgi:hypothetical protein